MNKLGLHFVLVSSPININSFYSIILYSSFFINIAYCLKFKIFANIEY